MHASLSTFSLTSPRLAPDFRLATRNLQRAIDLTNVVADERYQLYLEFVTERGNTVGEYLELVRLASVASLEGGNPLVAK